MTFALLVLAAFAIYLMTPEERARIVRVVTGVVRKAGEVRAPTFWPIVTGVILIANVSVFVAMLQDAGALSDPDTLVAWGGNVGPRTTNGERWRLFTSVFVHAGILHLLMTVVALAQAGALVERVAGRFTFAVVYVTAGVLAAVRSVALAPLTVSVGADGAVFGIYGLLIAVGLRGVLQSTAAAVPLRALKVLAPATLLFALHYVMTVDTYAVAKVGLCTGFTGGIVLSRGIVDRVVRVRRVAALTAATAAIVLIAAMALRVVADVRPDIAAVIAIEERTVRLYDAALDRFRNGRMSARALAQFIDEAIMPDLRGASARVSTLAHVPAQDEHLVADTENYLRLRHESWRLRADALRSGASTRKLREADLREHLSLREFEKVRSSVAQ